MLDMATTPPIPTPQRHHGHLRWTCRWTNAQGKQVAKRFGPVAEQPKKQMLLDFATWLQSYSQRSKAEAASGGRYTVNRMAEDAITWARRKYLRKGKASSSFDMIKLAMQDMVAGFNGKAVDDVRQPEIVKLRDEVFSYQWSGDEKKIKAGMPVRQTARTVNYKLWAVQQAYRIGRERGYVTAETLLDVLGVKRVSASDGIVRPTAKIKPVHDSIVDQTLAACSSCLGDMIRVQRLTGARPTEICVLRPCDIEYYAGDVWFYVPFEHKTEYAEKDRLIVIPAAAIEILTPYLNGRRTTDYIFSPIEHAGQMKLMLGRATPRPVIRTKWSKDTYRNAVDAACKRAGVEVWKPNQLRHRWATEVRRELGIEAVREGLSHSSTKITEIYAEKSREQLAAMARKLSVGA